MKVNGLGEAAWIGYLVRQDIYSELYVERLPTGYAIGFDDTLEAKHLPVVAEYEALDPSEFEAAYCRIVHQNAESCIEYIFYWNLQYLPPHSYDYESIYVRRPDRDRLSLLFSPEIRTVDIYAQIYESVLVVLECVK